MLLEGGNTQQDLFEQKHVDVETNVCRNFSKNIIIFN